MKTIIVHLEDSEHAELKELKGKQSWRSFILLLGQRPKVEPELDAPVEE